MSFEKIHNLISSEMQERNTLEQLSQEVSENLIFVLGGANALGYYQEGKEVFTDSCTTAKNGFGNIADSYKTPIGLHQVERMIGKAQNERVKIQGRRVFEGNIVSRPETGEMTHGIVGRVMVLKGLEPRVNLTTLARDIYIHGTSHDWFWSNPDEGTEKINLQRSLGCIGLRPEKIAELVDTRLGDTLPYVYISEKDEL